MGAGQWGGRDVVIVIVGVSLSLGDEVGVMERMGLEQVGGFSEDGRRGLEALRNGSGT